MPTIIDIINSAYGVYIKSCVRAELEGAADSLAVLFEGGALSKAISAENLENAQFLAIKLRLKALASEYFCEGYEHADFSALDEYASSARSECERLGFKKTGALIERVRKCAGDTDKVLADAVSLKGRLCDSEGRCVAKDADECRAVSKALADKITLIEELNLPEELFSDGAFFPDLRAQIIGDIKELCAVADGAAAALCAEQVEGFMRTAGEDITAELLQKRYEYYSTTDISDLARALVLFTPFAGEAELFAAVYSGGNKILRLQALAFENAESGAVTEFFNSLAREGADVIIYGMPHFRAGNKGDFYRAVMHFCRGGRRAYIVADDGTRNVYDEAVKCVGSGLTELDISFLYLSMPNFSQTVELLKELKMLPDGDDGAQVKSSMPFCGYVGLNEAVKAFNAGADWKEIAADMSRINFPAAEKYMLKLPRQALFIDGGWGNYHEDIIVNKAKRFDYDDIKAVNPENIRKIAEGNFTIFEKCGAICLYCLLSGAAADDWKTFPDETKNERIAEATKLVMRTLGIETVPVVEIVENPAGGALGLCCDGGKKVLYKESHISNLSGLSNTICHECFHAFQHYCIQAGWQEWYLSELHVTAGRIAEWQYNFSNYVSNSKGYSTYAVQIVESDARAFANDCLSKNGSADVILNAIDLD